jgi:hypothetical protein
LLLRLLVEVGDCDTSSEDGIIWVGDCHVCSSLCGLGEKLADACDAIRRDRSRSREVNVPDCQALSL